jgi:misacylated tRNA(Ala) deacylase
MLGRTVARTPRANDERERDQEEEGMGTELLYLTDSYLEEFGSCVVAVEDSSVALAATAFYPGGGGQQADTGMLAWDAGAARVVKARKAGDVVWHDLDAPGPAIDTTVWGEIDWAERYRMMRTHTALHILCGIIFHEYGALVTGCQMYPDKARMDFALEDLNADRVAHIGKRVSEVVAAAMPVRTRILSREEAFAIPDLIRTQINLLPEHIQHVRIVEIEGLDLQADGGTHVRSTAEVGAVGIIGAENKGRINKRLIIALE